MIVVTGSCRTGTSLMMQTLALLGVQVAGFAFHDDFPDKDLNPNGYWEFPISETLTGIHDGRYKGMAVKLFGLQLSRTEVELISRIIVCRRAKEAALQSTMRMLARYESRLGLAPTLENAAFVYETNYDHIDTYLHEHDVPHINVYFEIMLSQRQLMNLRIAEFLGIPHSGAAAATKIRR